MRAEGSARDAGAADSVDGYGDGVVEEAEEEGEVSELLFEG